MRHDSSRSYPRVDAELISSYSVERFITALFGRVEVDAEGNVTRGEESLGHLMCLAKIEANPYLVEGEFVSLEQAVEHAAREEAEAWRRDFAEQLAEHQDLRAALEVGPERVFDRAQLTALQRDVMRLTLQGDSQSGIARSLGISQREARRARADALDRIKGSETAEAKAS